MFLVCQSCFVGFEDEDIFPDMLGNAPDATVSDIADSALCDRCAGAQVVRLSSTTNLPVRSSFGTLEEDLD